MALDRQQILDRMLETLSNSPLPEAQTRPLVEALEALYASRPNAVDKLSSPLGRALRNPMFPGIWRRCVDDIPGSPAYAPLKQAAQDVADWVAAQGDAG